jgi:ribosomal protein S18 acetylase RimI-like enzyme
LKISDFTWQIGADIHPKFQNQGLASNAYPVFIDEIVRRIEPSPTLLELRVLKDNVIAFSLYTKLGFVIEEITELDLKMTLNLD